MNITSVTNHREREKGNIIYPVYSRRSAGLSVGVNLFPDKKTCQFDCPYCEVFPFAADAVFSLSQMEEDLRSAISGAREREIPVRDICFSGNGEPTLSPFFGEAIKIAEDIRGEMAAEARLVLITNGTGLSRPEIFSMLAARAACPAFDIWLKLDAATADWYQKINRASPPFEKLIEKIKEFAFSSPVTIQTMLCAVNGAVPPPDEEEAWVKLMVDLAKTGNIRKAQVYGKARPAPEDPLASALPNAYLEKRAAAIRLALTKNGLTVAVEVYP